MDYYLDLLTKAGIILGGFIALFAIAHFNERSKQKKDR